MNRILMIILCLCAPFVAVRAQKELRVEPVFEGKVIPAKRMVKAVVKGEQAKRYRLSLFQSLKMTADSTECQQIAELVRQDCRGLDSPLVQEYGMKEGRLSYLIAQLPNRQDEQVFLCYQCYEEPQGSFHLTLVYMEGPATMKDLYKMFKTENKK
jgi:hypothetical protein